MKNGWKKFLLSNSFNAFFWTLQRKWSRNPKFHTFLLQQVKKLQVLPISFVTRGTKSFREIRFFIYFYPHNKLSHASWRRRRRSALIFLLSFHFLEFFFFDLFPNFWTQTDWSKKTMKQMDFPPFFFHS